MKRGWIDSLRSTVMAGYYRATYPFAELRLADRTAYSLTGNLFRSRVKHLDLGIEYCHAQQEVVGGLTSQMNWFEMAAKYRF